MALLSSYPTETIITDTDRLLGSNENSETSLYTVGSIRQYLQNNLRSPIITSTHPTSTSLMATAHGPVTQGRAGLLFLDNNSTLRCAQINNQIDLVQDATAQTTNPISELTIDFSEITWDASSYGTTTKTTDNYFLYVNSTQWDSLVSAHASRTSLNSSDIWIYDPRDPTIKAKIDVMNFSASQYTRTDRSTVNTYRIIFKNMSSSFMSSDKISFNMTTLPFSTNIGSYADFFGYSKEANASEIHWRESTDYITGIQFWYSSFFRRQTLYDLNFRNVVFPICLMFFNDGIEMAYSTTDPSSATTGIQVSATQKLFKNCINNDGSLFFTQGKNQTSYLQYAESKSPSFGEQCRSIFLSTTRFVMVVNNPVSRLKLFTRNRDTLDLSTITTKSSFEAITSIGGYRSGWFNNAKGNASDNTGTSGVDYSTFYGRPTGFYYFSDTNIPRAIFVAYGALFSCLTTSYEKIFYKVEQDSYGASLGNITTETVCGFTSSSLTNQSVGRITDIIAWDNSSNAWKHFKIKNTINRHTSQTTATSASYDDITATSTAGGAYFAAGLTTRFNHSYSPALTFLIYDRINEQSKTWTLTKHDSLMPESIDGETGNRIAYPPVRVFDIFRISNTRFGISFSRDYFRNKNFASNSGRILRGFTPTALLPFHQFTTDDSHIKQHKQSIGIRSYQHEYYSVGSYIFNNFMILNLNNTNEVIPEIYESPENTVYNFSNDFTGNLQYLNRSFHVKSSSDNSLSLFGMYYTGGSPFQNSLIDINTTVSNYRSTIFKKYTYFQRGTNVIPVIGRDSSPNHVFHINGTRANIFHYTRSNPILYINLLTSGLDNKIANDGSGVIQYHNLSISGRVPDITSPGRIKWLQYLSLTYNAQTRVTQATESRYYYRNYIYNNFSTTIPLYVPNSNPRALVEDRGTSSVYIQFTGTTGEINRPLWMLTMGGQHLSSYRTIRDQMIFKELPSLLTFLTFNQVNSTNYQYYGVASNLNYNVNNVNTTWFQFSNIILRCALVRRLYFKDYSIESQLSIYRTLGQRTQGFFAESGADGASVRFILDNGSFLFSGLWDNLEPGKLYTINPFSGALEQTTDQSRVYGYALTSSILSKIRY